MTGRSLADRVAVTLTLVICFLRGPLAQYAWVPPCTSPAVSGLPPRSAPKDRPRPPNALGRSRSVGAARPSSTAESPRCTGPAALSSTTPLTPPPHVKMHYQTSAMVNGADRQTCIMPAYLDSPRRVCIKSGMEILRQRNGDDQHVFRDAAMNIQRCRRGGRSGGVTRSGALPRRTCRAASSNLCAELFILCWLNYACEDMRRHAWQQSILGSKPYLDKRFAE